MQVKKEELMVTLHFLKLGKLISSMFFMVCYCWHEVKNSCICFQWKRNTEVSSFSAKSLLRVIVTLSWYSSTHSICSKLRTIDFQTPANSCSALKWMLSLGFMHAGQSNRKSRWKWFLISCSVLILTWNFILGYLLLSDFANWGCFWVQLSWQLGHIFELALYIETRTWGCFVCIFDSTLLSWCDAQMSGVAGNGCDWHRAAQDLLPDKSKLPPLYWNPEGCAQYRGYSRKWFFLS